MQLHSLPSPTAPPLRVSPTAGSHPCRCQGSLRPLRDAGLVPLALAAAISTRYQRHRAATRARCGHSRTNRRALVALAASPSAKSELLELLSGENWDASRVNAAQRVEDLVAELTASFDKSKLESQEAQTLLAGRWKLLNTFTPGQAAANFFSLKSWQEYVFGKGPSPVQAAAFTNGAVQKEPCSTSTTAFCFGCPFWRSVRCSHHLGGASLSA